MCYLRCQRVTLASCRSFGTGPARCSKPSAHHRACGARFPGALTPSIWKVEPHVSLAVYEAFDPEPLARMLEQFAEHRHALAVRLSSIGLFPGPLSVLFAAPVVSADLLSVHRDFHRAAAFAEAAYWSHYLPGNWVPHVTLGERLNPEEAAAAISGAIDFFRPVVASLHSISLVRFPPVEVLWQKQLPN
jgi:2'-5' RNA ligase